MAQPVSISGVVARQQETSIQTRQPSPSLSKKSRISLLLTNFSLRRGAPVTAETLVIYAQDLSIYELDDIAEALDKFGQAVPEQFEPPFPCVGVFLRKVQSVASQRKRAERERLEELERAEKDRLYQEDLKANPEKYAARDREIGEQVAAFKMRHGFVTPQPKPTPPPVMTA